MDTTLSTEEVLGEDIPLNEPEILMWIDGVLKEQYEAIGEN